MNNFTYARLRTFRLCPQKHHYMYNEEIKGKETGLFLSKKLFSRCLSAYLTNETDDIAKAIKEFRKAAREGDIEVPEDTLDYVFESYCMHNASDLRDEEIIVVDQGFREVLDEEDDDTFYVHIDRLIYNKKLDMVILRNTKVSLDAINSDFNQTNDNEKLLTAVPFIEEVQGLRVQAIETDHVRLAKLQPVPINKNGKPTGNRKDLGLVTYEDYMEVIRDQGLEHAPEYQRTIEWLQQRGHPLFRRTQAQIINRDKLDINNSNNHDTYRLIKTGYKYMNRGALCWKCQFKELCNIDFNTLNSSTRDHLIEKLLRQSTEDSEE